MGKQQLAPGQGQTGFTGRVIEEYIWFYFSVGSGKANIRYSWIISLLHVLYPRGSVHSNRNCYSKPVLDAARKQKLLQISVKMRDGGQEPTGASDTRTIILIGRSPEHRSWAQIGLDKHSNDSPLARRQDRKNRRSETEIKRALRRRLQDFHLTVSSRW